MIPPPATSTLFPYSTLFRALAQTLPQKRGESQGGRGVEQEPRLVETPLPILLAVSMPPLCLDPSDRKSTRLNSSHVSISYAVFCLKKKKITSIFANDHNSTK